MESHPRLLRECELTIGTPKIDRARLSPPVGSDDGGRGEGCGGGNAVHLALGAVSAQLPGQLGTLREPGGASGCPFEISRRTVLTTSARRRWCSCCRRACALASAHRPSARRSVARWREAVVRSITGKCSGPSPTGRTPGARPGGSCRSRPGFFACRRRVEAKSWSSPARRSPPPARRARAVPRRPRWQDRRAGAAEVGEHLQLVSGSYTIRDCWICSSCTRPGLRVRVVSPSACGSCSRSWANCSAWRRRASCATPGPRRTSTAAGGNSTSEISASAAMCLISAARGLRTSCPASGLHLLEASARAQSARPPRIDSRQVQRRDPVAQLCSR